MTTKSDLPQIFKPSRSKEAKSPKPKLPPRRCVCSCGEMTKGGEFLPGHDARYKSALIREVKAGGNDEARAELERRGWTKFLDKSLNNDRVQAERRSGIRPAKVRESVSSDEEGTARYYRYRKAQKATAVLKAVGRYGKAAGERRIEIVLDDDYLESIIAGSHHLFTDEDRAVIEAMS